MVSVPMYPLMSLFMEEARSRSLLISMVPLFFVDGVTVVKSSKNPLLLSVEFMLNNKIITPLWLLQDRL